MERSESLWFQAAPDRLVELATSRFVAVKQARDGELGVWLCGDGPYQQLYSGPDAYDYLAGLAKMLGAVGPDTVIALGKYKQA